MNEQLLLGLTLIILLGVGAQLIAWRFSVPSILLLLIIGFISGPVTGLVNPTLLFGDLLFPLVSISVAIILFEGGLSLKISELKETRNVVLNLVSIGVLISWLLISLASYFILTINIQLSILLGAILVVTGPTVIVPMLRQIRPSGRIGTIVKWEGIVIDPIGAILAVIVFEAILAEGFGSATINTLYSVILSIIIGVILGLLGARLIVEFFRRYWVPDFLQNPFSLMLVIVVFAASNYIQDESGLLSVTVMGIALANQSTVSIKHILEFKENLRVLLIASLFIILASRIQIDQITYVIGFSSLIFLVFLIIIVRPLSIFISTFRSNLTLREKAFLSCIAPRGIVAASVSSVFALRLTEANFQQADALVPITFFVITGTVLVYSLITSRIARFLGISRPDPQGMLFLGSHSWSRVIAHLLIKEGFKIILIDSNWNNVSKARAEGLRADYGNILSEDIIEDIDLDGIGRILSITSNDEINSLTSLHFADYFGKNEVYQLAPQSKFSNENGLHHPQHLRGRILFQSNASYSFLDDFFSRGGVLEKNYLSREFNFEDFKDLHKERAVPLFLIKKNGDLNIFTSDNFIEPEESDILIFIIRRETEKLDE